MTSVYDARQRRVGSTVLFVGPNVVTQVKNKDEKDGYNAIQLGFGNKKSVKKPQIGHAKKAGLDQKIRWFREVRLEGEIENLKPGTEIKLNQVFSPGDSVKVSGISKGKGFQGGVRRHGFAGGPKTHGQSDRHRAPGSIGAGTTPGRVYKGKRMAGHMGAVNVSTKGLEVISVDKKNNLITIKGAVPGSVGGLVTITKLGRIKGYIAPPEEKVEEEGSSEVEAMENKEEGQGVNVEKEETEQVEQVEVKGEENAKE